MGRSGSAAATPLAEPLGLGGEIGGYGLLGGSLPKRRRSASMSATSPAIPTASTATATGRRASRYRRTLLEEIERSERARAFPIPAIRPWHADPALLGLEKTRRDVRYASTSPAEGRSN